MNYGNDKNIIDLIDENAQIDAHFGAYSMDKVDATLADEVQPTRRTRSVRDHGEAIGAALDEAILHVEPRRGADERTTTTRLFVAEDDTRVWRCERHGQGLYGTAYESTTESCLLCDYESDFASASAAYKSVFGRDYGAEEFKPNKKVLTRVIGQGDYAPGGSHGPCRLYSETRAFAKRERIQVTDWLHVQVDARTNVAGCVVATDGRSTYTVVWVLDPRLPDERAIEPDVLAVALHHADVERRFPAARNTDLSVMRAASRPCHRCGSPRFDVLDYKIRCLDCGKIARLEIPSAPATAWERLIEDDEHLNQTFATK